MEKVLISGLVLLTVNVICAAKVCDMGYFKNGTACVHCSKKTSPDLYKHECGGLCHKGFHGHICSDHCSRNCEWSYCDRWTGNCTYGCINNRYGDQCNIRCSHGCIEKKCNRLGECVHGCRRGFYGSLCLQCPKNCVYCDPKLGCQKCIPGHYGKTCQIPCLKCKGNKCDINGTCTYGCKVSLFGAKCNKECPPNCASGHCTNGACDGCKPGYRGSHCNMTCPQNCTMCRQFKHACTACKIGSYGFLCNKMCDNCTKHLCNNDGHCTDSCIQNHYGNKCDMVCSKYCKGNENGLTTCSEKTGRCTNGCTDGWFGGVCDKRCSTRCLDALCEDGPSGGLICTDGCERGLWGPGCLYECPAKCLTCHNSTGTCRDCANGTYGYGCSQTCSGRCEGQDCDITGICRRGCVHGWMGEKCQLSVMWFLLPGILAALFVVIFVILCLRKSLPFTCCLLDNLYLYPVEYHQAQETEGHRLSDDRSLSVDQCVYDSIQDIRMSVDQHLCESVSLHKKGYTLTKGVISRSLPDIGAMGEESKTIGNSRHWQSLTNVESTSLRRVKI